MTLSITGLTVLEVGKQIPLGPGDTLVVKVSFGYFASEASDVTLWASLGIGVGRDIESFLSIHLDKALVPQTWEGTTEIFIPTSDKTDAVYWMKVEVNGTEVTIPNAVVISGMPAGTFEMIGPLLVLGLLAAMMPMLSGGSD